MRIRPPLRRPQLRDRWKRGVGLVEGTLGEAVGELDVTIHFPPAAKERMLELVDNLVPAIGALAATLLGRHWLFDWT